MCELFGFSSGCEMNMKQYLTEFFSHSTQHPNGWGLAEFKGDAPILRTEPISAYKSTLLHKIIEEGISAKILMAHIRKATVGGIRPENCHPFFMRDNMGNGWTLMHNGTIFSGLELIPYTSKQKGDTDSERILMYLIDKINDAAEKRENGLNSFERFKVVEQMISELSYRNKLNLIIFDGNQMYVHVNMKDTLFYQEETGGICFATVPLNNRKWEPVPLTSLLVYRDGHLKYKGKNHHNEYVDAMNSISASYSYNI